MLYTVVQMMLISSVAPIVKTIEKFSTGVSPPTLRDKTILLSSCPNLETYGKTKSHPLSKKSETAFYIVVSYVEYIEFTKKLWHVGFSCSTILTMTQIIFQKLENNVTMLENYSKSLI